MGAREGGVDVAVRERDRRRHVVAPVGVDQRRAGRQRLLRIDDGGKRLVGHDDGGRGVRRLVRIGGDHDRHRLAGEADDAVGQRGLAVGLDRRRGDRRRRQRAAELGKVGQREDAGHARVLAGAAGIERDEACVRMRAAHDDRVQRALEGDVGDVAAAAGEEAVIFSAPQRLPDQAPYSSSAHSVGGVPVKPSSRQRAATDS